jgi:hypothetical protein
MTRRQLLITLILPCLLVAAHVAPAAAVPSQMAAQAAVRYFGQTGHSVQGEFLAFFDKYGAESIFGLPRTEEFFEGTLKVQYFQRVRMEHHPGNPPPYQVQLALLGDLLGYRASPISPQSIPPLDNAQRRYYPQTGHTLSYGFLQYYDRHGGLDVFGYPITELQTEQGTAVQYFQRGKMEWHPENAPPYQVTLGNLGDEYIAYTRLPQAYLDPASPAAQPAAPTYPTTAAPTAVPEMPTVGPSTVDTPVPAPVLPSPNVQPTPALRVDFSVSAWVKYPVTGQGGTQTVYVSALSGSAQEIRDAAIEAIVHFREGDQVFHTNTDTGGHASITFGIGQPAPGYTIMIEVRVTYGGRTVTAQTPFIIW